MGSETSAIGRRVETLHVIGHLLSVIFSCSLDVRFVQNSY